MTPQKAINNIETRFLSGVDPQRIRKAEWELIKAELQRLGRIEDSVKLMGER